MIFFYIQVQPVDTTTVNDMRTRSPTCKGLLTSSPIIHMAWESTEFNKPVTVCRYIFCSFEKSCFKVEYGCYKKDLYLLLKIHHP